VSEGLGISPQPEQVDSFPAPVDDPLWRLEVSHYVGLREREFESWFTVANGRTGTRGSLEEGAPESNPAVYTAGIFGRLHDSASGPEPLLGPLWTSLVPRRSGAVLKLEFAQFLEHRRVLDLQQGILFRNWRLRLPTGVEISFRSARFASMADRALTALQAEGLCSDGGFLVLGDDIPLPSTVALEHAASSWEQGVVHVELAARGGGRAWFSIGTSEQDGSLERIAAVSRQAPGKEPEGSAEDALRRAQAEGVPTLRDRHCSAWKQLWSSADVTVEGDPDAQLALRFDLYHLMSSGDPDSDLASIGARGLTGPGYQGHVFWDTDVFVFPFFLRTHLEVARRLIGYRWRTLPAARARARELGYQGALYAWESADDGTDCTPPTGVGPDGAIVPVLTGLEEHHISADVAWATWHYWEATRDEDFLWELGAEIILETARFWASRARPGEDGAHHIMHVIGPDEYHEDVHDNAFTNELARWNLERGLEVAELLGGVNATAWRALASRLDLRPDELAHWRTVAQTLDSRFDPQTLLFEQFAGYFKLEDLIAADLAPRPFAGDLVLGRERLHRSQVIKQADVLMLMHMLPNAFPDEVVRANYRYYEPRTSHGSSLSPAIHSAVAGRLGLVNEALAYFRMAASIDLDDRMGNAAMGIHMAAAGGLWQAAVMGFGGVRPEADRLRIQPRLPASWSRLAFPIRWRGTLVRLAVRQSELEIELESAATVALGDRAPRQLPAGRYRATIRGEDWSEPEEVEIQRHA
jgi:kojibiose phosphorylase